MPYLRLHSLPASMWWRDIVPLKSAQPLAVTRSWVAELSGIVLDTIMGCSGVNSQRWWNVKHSDGPTAKKKKKKDRQTFLLRTETLTPARKGVAKQWLDSIGTGHTLKIFPFGRNSVVCEDHFEPWCYEKSSAGTRNYAPSSFVYTLKKKKGVHLPQHTKISFRSRLVSRGGGRVHLKPVLYIIHAHSRQLCTPLCVWK